MGRKQVPIPLIRLHRATGQAYCNLSGKRVYLGRYGSPESEERHRRVIAEWQAHGQRLPANASDVTVVEVVNAYGAFTERRFQDRASGHKALSRIRAALEPVRQLYGRTRAAEFDCRALRTVRDAYVRLGWSRKTVNERTQIVRAMFRWSASEKMVPAAVWHELQTLTNLRAGESPAREPRKVRPVPEAHVDAVLQHVLPPVRAMIQLQRLTGMRPAEAVSMKGCELNMEGNLWEYRPGQHKSKHRDLDRIIMLGKKAQALIQPFLQTDLDVHLFRPDLADRHRRAILHEQRKTPESCGNVPGSNVKVIPKRQPGAYYTVSSYARAIARSCTTAGVPKWSPNQLRHLYGTLIRKAYGIEISRVMLGHRHVATSEIYAERDQEVALRVARKLG